MRCSYHHRRYGNEEHHVFGHLYSWHTQHISFISFDWWIDCCWRVETRRLQWRHFSPLIDSRNTISYCIYMYIDSRIYLVTYNILCIIYLVYFSEMYIVDFICITYALVSALFYSYLFYSVSSCTIFLFFIYNCFISYITMLHCWRSSGLTSFI